MSGVGKGPVPLAGGATLAYSALSTFRVDQSRVHDPTLEVTFFTSAEQRSLLGSHARIAIMNVGMLATSILMCFIVSVQVIGVIATRLRGEWTHGMRSSSMAHTCLIQRMVTYQYFTNHATRHTELK